MTEAAVTTNGQQQIIKYDEATALKKGENWKVFGTTMYKKEINLQLRAQQIIAAIPAPTTIEQLPEFEKNLTQARADLIKIKNERIAEITGKFDAIATRLMQPEKSVEAHIKGLEPILIGLKKANQEKQQAGANKANELKAVREHMIRYAADMQAAILKQQTQWLTDGYSYALDNITLEALPNFLKTLKARVSIAPPVKTGVQLTTIPPPAFKAVHNTQLDLDNIIITEFDQGITPAQLKDGYDNAVNEKFSDFEIALKNKPKAKEINANEQQQITQAIDTAKDQAHVAATFVSAASEISSGPTGIKDLKKVYKLDIEETKANAVKVMAAFAANMQKCMEHLRLSKWFNLSVKQMMSALQDEKNKDNAFEVTGLTFIETDKL